MNFKIFREEEVVTTTTSEVEVSLLGYIGNRVTEFRKSADINISQFSRRLANNGANITPTNISRIEKGIANLKLEELVAIANYFDVGLNEFIPSQVLESSINEIPVLEKSGEE